MMLMEDNIIKLHHKFKRHSTFQQLGTNHRQYARLVRILTKHFPCGEFRTRFNKDGPIYCSCFSVRQTNNSRKGVLETRNHILYECPLWIRPNEWKRYNHVPDNVHDKMWPPNNQDINLEQLIEFLRLNPLVGAFEWGELQEYATKARENRDNGNTHWLTAEFLYFKLMTDVRKQYFHKWNETRKQKRKPPSGDKFNK